MTRSSEIPDAQDPVECPARCEVRGWLASARSWAFQNRSRILYATALLIAVIGLPYAIAGYKHLGLVDGLTFEVVSIKRSPKTEGNVGGSLVNPLGEPMAGVPIAIFTEEGVWRTSTGSDGRFSVSTYRRIVERIEIGQGSYGVTEGRGRARWQPLLHGAQEIPESMAIDFEIAVLW